MPTYTITATCGGETQTALVHVPGEQPERIIRQSAQATSEARNPGRYSWQVHFPAYPLSPSTRTITRPDGTTDVTTIGTASTTVGGNGWATRNGVYTQTVVNPDWPTQPAQVTFEITDMLAITSATVSGATVTVTAHTTAGFPTNVNQVTFAWGDGTTDLVTVSDIHNVAASHTYASAGQHDVTVSATGVGIDTRQVTTTAGNPGRFVLRADVTRDPIARIWADDVPEGVDQLTIEWGDDSTEVVTRAGGFTASHEYDANGDYTVIARAPGLERAQTTFNIGDADDRAVVSWARRAPDHLAFHQVTGLPLTDTVARIEWGDGTTTDVPAADGKAGDLTQPPTATHIYARGRSYHARVVSLPSGRTSASLTITV